MQAARPKYRRLHGWRAPLISLRNALGPSLPTQVFLAVALLLALVPVWLLSVLIEWLTPLDRVAVFWVLVVLTYAGSLLLGFSGFGRRIERVLGLRAVAHAAAPVPGTSKRVAVIGAGMAGLVAAKELQECGHEVVVFERAPRWGGVWAQEKLRGGSAWNTTVTSTGAMNSTLSDCPIPVLNPDNGDTPMHFTREQFFNMLEQYEDRHSVFNNSLRLNTEVTELQELPGRRWRVSSHNRDDGTRSVEDFDAITVCTGLNQDRLPPTLPGADTFRGQQLHLDDVESSDVEAMADRRVVVVGTGESAADLVEELAKAGATDICVSHRSSTICLPRNYTTIPPDHTENRITYGGPMFNRWGILLSSSFLMMLPLVLPTRVRPPSMINWIRLFRPWRTIRAFPSIMGSVNVTKSDGLWRQLDAKTAHLAPGLASLGPNHVEFTNGDRHQADVIIYCTGYTTDHSFLPPVGDGATVEIDLRDEQPGPVGEALTLTADRAGSGAVPAGDGARSTTAPAVRADQPPVRHGNPGAPEDTAALDAPEGEGDDPTPRPRKVAIRDLYKLTLSPDYANVAFIGFARGQIGAITLSSELQARWWAGIVSGRTAVPSEREMRREIARTRRHSRRFTQATRTTMTFANSIARNDLDCEPDMYRLFRTDRRMWLRVLCGPMSNSHYRLHGVGAKPDLARQQLNMPGAVTDDDYVDSVDIIYNILPLALAALPFWSIYERLIPSMRLRSALRSYV